MLSKRNKEQEDIKDNNKAVKYIAIVDKRVAVYFLLKPRPSKEQSKLKEYRVVGVQVYKHL